MGALVLFSGFVLPKRWLVLPLAALAATDAILGTYHWQVMFAVYGSYAVMLAAAYTARQYYSFAAVLGANVGAAVLFFLATNAAVALWSGMYPQTFDGVMASYIAAIPFFRGTLAGHLVYGAAFFGIYELARLRAIKHTASISKKAESAITGIVM